MTTKGSKVVTIPLAPRTARAIDPAVGERADGHLPGRRRPPAGARAGRTLPADRTLPRGPSGSQSVIGLRQARARVTAVMRAAAVSWLLPDGSTELGDLRAMLAAWRHRRSLPRRARFPCILWRRMGRVPGLGWWSFTTRWEWTQEVRNQAAWLAGQGYLAVVPDLFRGRGKVACMISVMRDVRARGGRSFDDIEAARAWLAARGAARARSA